MGNLCGKKADVVPVPQPQPSAQELEQNNNANSSSKKDDGPQGYATVVQPTKGNTTAELLGIKETKVIFVIEEKAIVEDKKPQEEKKSSTIEKFEHGLPFNQVNILAYVQAVQRAHEACGKLDFVTIEALRQELTTTSWKPLEDKTSKLYKILHSSAFKNINKGQGEEQIDVEYLVLMGLLHCKHEKHSQEKALAFYNVVQEGGLALGQWITAGDKDLNPAIQKICELATINLYEWMSDLVGVENPYEPNELEALTESWENLAEDYWKEDVFGVQSRLDDSDFLKKTTETGKWLFKPYDLRVKIFACAKTTDKHYYVKEKKGVLGLGLVDKVKNLKI